MSDKYEALRESLGAMSRFGEWERTKSHIDIAETEEWPSVRVNVWANKLASRKVANYISVARPDVTRALLAERDALLDQARATLLACKRVERVVDGVDFAALAVGLEAAIARATGEQP
jgi:hypothetical protein